MPEFVVNCPRCLSSFTGCGPTPEEAEQDARLNMERDHTKEDCRKIVDENEDEDETPAEFKKPKKTNNENVEQLRRALELRPWQGNFQADRTNFIRLYAVYESKGRSRMERNAAGILIDEGMGI